MRWRLALLSASLVALTGFAAGAFATRMIMFPRRKPLAVTPAEARLAYEDVEFQARYDRKRLSAWFMPRATPAADGCRHAVIAVHGWNTHRADQLVGALELYSGLVNRGLDLLAIDLRGRGRSAGAANRFGDTEYRDVLGAFDWLAGQSDDAGRPLFHSIAVHGF